MSQGDPLTALPEESGAATGPGRFASTGGRHRLDALEASCGSNLRRPSAGRSRSRGRSP